tara:strand:- start:234 stop:1517 length:1284 start_codon:yes stop_codon:yes gene_type:complete
VTKFKFDLQFQRKIIALTYQDYPFLCVASNLIKPDNFESFALSWFFTSIRDYYLDYESRPTRLALKNEIAKAKTKKILKSADMQEIKRLYGMLTKRLKDADYVRNEVRSFIRHQEIKRAMVEAIPLLEQERYDDIEDIWDRAKQIGHMSFDVGQSYFEDYKDRVIRRSQENVGIPTGIHGVDEHLRGGGLCPQELGLVQAATGVGKSQALVQFGKSALVRKKKVVHYTMEMSEDAIAERYDMTWSGVSISRGDNPDYARLFKRLNKLGKAYRESLIIKEFPTGTTTVSDLRAHLTILEQQLDFVPDVIIVDYGDIMRPTRRVKEKRERIGEVFGELLALAQEYNVPLWSGTQANRDALNKSVVTIKNLSESIEHAKIATVVLALCQTEQEKEDNEMRIYFAKNRNDRSGILVPIQTAFHRGQFYVNT